MKIQSFPGYFPHKLAGIISIIIASVLISSCALDDNKKTNAPKALGKAKYVFLFIGDGMSEVQINAAEIYKASISVQEDPGYVNTPELLNMTKFPATGYATTYDAGSYITDSASAGTAMACGYKTLSGVIGMDITKTTSYKTIADAAKEKGMKVGIVSSVSIDHATPASFYAQIDSREKYYEIGMQLANRGFDYYGGGGFRTNKYPAPYTNTDACLNAAIANGYKYVNDRAGFEALTRDSGKVIAVNKILDASRALPYELVREKSVGSDDISLAEYTKKGIELLENPDGFFFMVEGGKIDWACHANDAASSIHDTIAFDDAVAEALSFYQKYPGETLIIVTGDHECGGLTIGFAGTQYSTFLEKLQQQTVSFDKFDDNYLNTAYLAGVNALTDMYPVIESSFGLDLDKNGDTSLQLNDYQLSLLTEAFDKQKNGKGSMGDEQFYQLYGGYKPLSVTITHLVNQISGIAWTSYSHTGVPVPVFAKGADANTFIGFYDNTDLCKKMAAAMGIAFPF